MTRKARGERDYASYDSYLRDQGICPDHMTCLRRDGTCLKCEIDKENEEAEREDAIAKDAYYNADGYAAWEDNR
jgi:hypothetical protein